jgi:hypothetical protein
MQVQHEFMRFGAAQSGDDMIAAFDFRQRFLDGDEFF